jgi:hypothetical protein
MVSLKRGSLYGLGVWVVPFVVAIAIFPLREAERPLFESIMPVAVGCATLLFALLYLKNVQSGFSKEFMLLGWLWFAISIAIDLLMFMQGPMQMAFSDYVKDIGVTYLLIPVITFGIGSAAQRTAKA